jgi:hypothetical protein
MGCWDGGGAGVLLHFGRLDIRMLRYGAADGVLGW